MTPTGFFKSRRSSQDSDDVTYKIGYSHQTQSNYSINSDKISVPGFQSTVFDDGRDIIPHEPTSRWQSFKDSFKPADFSQLDMIGLSDVEKAAVATANQPLIRQLKSRHLQMIAVGGAIGTGLFISTGTSLSNGGPGAVLIGFTIIGFMLMATVHALGELAVCFPVAGAYSTYATRFIDPAWGFAMGWNSALRWLLVFPLELVAAAMTIKYWAGPGNSAANVNPAAWISLFYVVILLINLLGVRGYGEAEFIFSLVKVLAIIAFIIIGVIMATGHGPKGAYIETNYWIEPGSFAHGFKGVLCVFVNSAFAFSGTEVIGLAAAETVNPRKAIPTAIKRVLWKILVFYIGTFTVIGFLVPYNEPALMTTDSTLDTSISPFVIALKNAGLYGLPSFFNAVILLSVLSVGNASIYACTRTISALAAQGQAPKIFGYIDRKGRPLAALGLTALFGLVAFSAASGKEKQALTWLLALTGLSSIFTWFSISLSHIRFRMALKVQGRNTNELWVPSVFGVWGSAFAMIIDILIIGAQIWVGLFPVKAKGKADVENFFQVALAIPIAALFYFPYKFYYKTKLVSLRDMDLDTGRRETDLELLRIEIMEERERVRARGFLYRMYTIWC